MSLDDQIWGILRNFDDFATKCLFWKLSNPFVEMIKTAAFSTFSKFWTQNYVFRISNMKHMETVRRFKVKIQKIEGFLTFGGEGGSRRVISYRSLRMMSFINATHQNSVPYLVRYRYGSKTTFLCSVCSWCSKKSSIFQIPYLLAQFPLHFPLKNHFLNAKTQFFNFFFFQTFFMRSKNHFSPLEQALLYLFEGENQAIMKKKTYFLIDYLGGQLFPTLTDHLSHPKIMSFNCGFFSWKKYPGPPKNTISAAFGGFSPQTHPLRPPTWKAPQKAAFKPKGGFFAAQQSRLKPAKKPPKSRQLPP